MGWGRTSRCRRAQLSPPLMISPPVISDRPGGGLKGRPQRHGRGATWHKFRTSPHLVLSTNQAILASSSRGIDGGICLAHWWSCATQNRRVRFERMSSRSTNVATKYGTPAFKTNAPVRLRRKSQPGDLAVVLPRQTPTVTERRKSCSRHPALKLA